MILGIKRDGEARNVEMALGQATVKRYTVSESSSANERQKRILQGILHGTTD